MAESSTAKRSNLIDVTYQQLHASLTGHLEGTSSEQVTKYLLPRLGQLKNVKEPFGSPTDASKKQIESGTVTLGDGVVLRVEQADKAFVYAISSRFGIDQVNALVLLRSFLYNQGLPTNAGSEDELVEAITPFYYSERLFALRVLIPLFRANQNADDDAHSISLDVLPKLIPDGAAFADTLLSDYMRRSEIPLPENLYRDPKGASRWAKQNMKEQLVILEVLFWAMWGYAPCSPRLVVRILETFYTSNLGTMQVNSTLLLDEEGLQLQQDVAALWILISVEVLELERVAESGGIELSATPTDTEIYLSSPAAIKRVHQLVLANAGGQYVTTYLAWAFVLSRLTATVEELPGIPENYRSFFDSLAPHPNQREPIHILMSRTCIDPQVKLFSLLQAILTSSPLLVTAAAWKTGSTVTDPNAIAFRSVLKGLLIGLLELVSVELIPDFDGLVEVWIALFGRSESRSISGICRQFWQLDWRQGNARRAILDVARTRFPIQFKPLIRLLRAMTASGFLDTDPLSTSDHSHEGQGLDEDRELCDRHVFYYLDKLPTYSQVIPISQCTGTNALYEKQQERYSSAQTTPGLAYATLRAIKLPGGTILPAKTTGRLISGDTGDHIVVLWQHDHSGWKLILEVLTDYVNRKRVGGQSGGERHQDVSFGRRGAQEQHTIHLEDVGMEIDAGGDESLVTDAFDLVRSVIQDNPAQAEQLLESLESGEPVVSHTMTESQPPDLVQLTTMILEEALSRTMSKSQSQSRTQLITSAMSVLSALLALPKYSNRVWLYIRSTTALFGSDRAIGFASAALAAERVTGHYNMTLALLHLVQQLFHESSSAVLAVLPSNTRLQQIKDEVLLRATRFVHAEIWVEHLGWKYAQLGDRFEIGRRVSTFFADVLTHSPPTLEERPFKALSQAVADLMLHRATTSTINPLVTSITGGNSLLAVLYTSRRFGDARKLIYLLESHLLLTRLVLNYKQKSSVAEKPCLLEQALCTPISSGVAAPDNNRSKVNPMDVLAGYVKQRDAGNTLPISAMKVLYALCASMSSTNPSPSSIIAHLSDPESTVTTLVRIVQHPYDELALRNAAWSFISLAIDREPALASLFVTGEFRIPHHLKGKGKAGEVVPEGATTLSALQVARGVFDGWRRLWETNPELLASVMHFLDVLWEHGSEHKAALAPLREDPSFWSEVALIVEEPMGPLPNYIVDGFVNVDDVHRSQQHDVASAYAYRVIVKSRALNLIGRDITIHLKSKPDPTKKPLSYLKLEDALKSQKRFTTLIVEAAPSCYDPQLYDELMVHVEAEFPAFVLDQLQSQEPLSERELGDHFAFSIELLQSRLQCHPLGDVSMTDHAEEIEKHVRSINLNLSLSHSHTSLTESWQFLLRQIVSYVRGDASIRPIALEIAASVSQNIASETRAGDMMATIHGCRLALLLSLVEVAWFSTTDQPEEVKAFIKLVHHTHGIILNVPQSPSKSFLGRVTVPFHRSLLQVVYFCARHCRSLARRPKGLNAEQRLTIAAMFEASLSMTVDALRLVFDAARTRLDVDLDRDMELLVAVFEQCTHLEMNPSSTQWLARCQETDVIRASLETFVEVDLVGLSDVPLLVSRRNPLYAPHILVFHMTLASIPSSAERFASEGVLAAFCNNGLSSGISSGKVDVVLPELPGERSPAHRAYCTMVSVTAAVVNALGRHNHYFDAEASGFVQLYGDQISRALSWTMEDSITFPLVEEIEQVVNLFYSIAANAPSSANTNPAVEKVLRVFTSHALLLLQQLNYALNHPHQLANLFEPVTVEERLQYEKEATSTTAESNPLRRPLIAQLAHRLFRLTSNIVSTLIIISRAETVLIGQQEDWPLSEAFLIPHSKVIPGEPASLGTMLELGTCTLDILRDLAQRPGAQALPTPVSSPFSTHGPLDVKRAVLTARRNLEALLLYSVTQLAMWLSKPEYDGPRGDTEGDEQQMQSSSEHSVSGKERRVSSRTSTTLADRMRRGMTGEMAQDLNSLINKAKVVVAESNKVLGDKEVDVMQVLSNFLQERVISLGS